MEELRAGSSAGAAELSEVFPIPCLAVPAVPVPDGDPVSAQCCSTSSPAPPRPVPRGRGRAVLPSLPALPALL